MLERSGAEPDEELMVADVHLLRFHRHGLSHDLFPTGHYRYFIQLALKPVRLEQSCDTIFQRYNIRPTGGFGRVGFFQSKQV